MHRLRELVTARGSGTPNAPALIDPTGSVLTHRQMADQTRTLAGRLRDLGVERQDRVGIAVRSPMAFGLTFLAVTECAIAAPLNPRMPPPELARTLDRLDLSVLVTDGAVPVAALEGLPTEDLTVLHAEESRSPGRDLLTLHERTARRRTKRPGSARGADTAGTAHDVALLLQTSGTTGAPKLVPLTHENLCRSSVAIARSLRLTPGDRCLNVMPLFHIHGLVAGFLAALYSGGGTVCVPEFSAQHMTTWLEDTGATWYSAVPSMHQSVISWLRHHPLDERSRSAIGLRLIRSASSALPLHVAEGLRDIFEVPVIEAYGMSECAHQIACTPLPPEKAKPGSVGKAAGTEIRIAGNTSATQQGVHIGEVLVRGPNVFGGYGGDQAEHAETFQDGWFRTGDEGHIDAEGYLFLRGRTKEMINRGGETIAPREIDDELLRHPGVADAASFAVSDHYLGEAVAAAVVPAPGTSVSESELKRYLSERLSSSKVPAGIVFVDEIPKGPTGKVQRRLLPRQLGLTESPKATPAVDRSDALTAFVVSELKVLWADVLSCATVEDGSHFTDLGGDSGAALRLLATVEERFDLTLVPGEFLGASTVAEQAALIAALMPGDAEETSRGVPSGE